MAAAEWLDIDLEAEIFRLDRKLALESFADFVRLVRPTYDIQWFHDVIIAELERAGLSAVDSRFGMALPPGHAKSEYAMLFCAWMAARDRNITIKYVTYNADFAKEQLERIKLILQSDEYVRLFGEMINDRRVVTDTSKGARNSASLVELIGGRGWIQACGFGGGITGGRCDLIVIDDPFKGTEDAGSPTIRERRWREYGAAVKTRRKVGRPLRIVMLFTRWHLDDLVGRCKEIEGEDWRWVELEALKEGANDNQEVEDLDPREDGDALWDAVADAPTLLKERAQRPEIFACVWQQKPVPDGGAVFKSHHFTERWQWLEALLAQPGQWVQSWDCRNDGKGKRSSRCAAGLFFLPDREPARAYLVDVRFGRWSPDETLEIFDALQADPLWGRASVRLIEAKADGKMLLSLRQRRYVGMTPIEVGQDKVTRAKAVVPLTASGALVVAQAAEWLAEWLAEMLRFPAAATDDLVDMTTQLLAWRWLQAIDKKPPPPDPLEAARARRARHGVR